MNTETLTEDKEMTEEQMRENKEQMMHDMDRFALMMEQAVAEISADGGNIRFFAAAVLTGAVHRQRTA